MRADKLLAPGEVAVLLGIDPKTVSRLANAGKLPCLFTEGRHRRFRAGDVAAYLARLHSRGGRS